MSATSVIYRLHPSYNEAAEDPDNGQFHEVIGPDDKFYLGRIDSEDDYTVEAYMRWNDGRARMIKRTVTAALRAHYEALSAEAAAEQKVNPEVIRRTIIGLENENLQLPARRRKVKSRSSRMGPRRAQGKRT